MEDIHERRSWATEQRSLILALLVTGSIVALEVIGGIISNSLALLSDAWHMFTDFLALTTCLVAGTIATKPPTISKSFGYHRIEILAAFGNGIALVVVALFIYYQAINRIFQPLEVKSLEMLTVASVVYRRTWYPCGPFMGKGEGLERKGGISSHSWRCPQLYRRSRSRYYNFLHELVSGRPDREPCDRDHYHLRYE